MSRCIKKRIQNIKVQWLVLEPSSLQQVRDQWASASARGSASPPGGLIETRILKKKTKPPQNNIGRR